MNYLDTIVLETFDKKKIELESSCLLFFIDETGEETLNDPNCPIFGLGGCATLVSDYISIIKRPWEFIKTEFFDGVEKNLHATEIRNPSSKQIKELNTFFSSHLFSRFAVIIGDNSKLGDGLSEIQITFRCLWDRIIDIAKAYSFSSIAIIFEESDRGDKLMEQYFSGYKIKRGKEDIPIKLCFLKKRSLEAGLEVADFVIHTAGRQSRRMNVINAKQEFEPDYDKVFKCVDKKFVSFMHIIKATKNNP